MQVLENKRSYGKIILEFAVVIFGVFIGLIANEYRLSQNRQAQAEKVLRYIEDEISGNAARIDSVLSIHRTINDSLNVLAGKIDKTKITYPMLIGAMPRGFLTPSLEFTGWHLLNNTGSINEIGLPLAYKISKTYNQQEYLLSRLRMIGQNFYLASNNGPDRIESLVIALVFLSNDIIIHEEQVRGLYTKLLEMMKEGE